MRRFRHARGDDKGSALFFVAGSLVLLMGLAAMGTDLAWFYLNTARVQRAADAAALGGVVWMPHEQTNANDTARSVASQNGYEDGVDNAVVTPSPVPGKPNQLQVTIDDNVPTFFLKVLGFPSMDISRSATAEYIPPLRLGSPENQFGNNCDPVVFGAGCGNNFWANIHGRWNDNEMGDAFAPFCTDANDDPGCSPLNDLRRPEGYLYGIESDTGFTVEFIDLAFHNISNGTGCPGNRNPNHADADPLPQHVPEGCTTDWTRTGDRGCEDWGASSSVDCGPTMYVALYAPDPTPLLLDSAPVCEATVAPTPQVSVFEPYDWETPDGQSCWAQSGDGTWVVQVAHTNQPQVNRSGLNRYAIHSTAGSLYALSSFSIYNNANATTTEFHLAEVPPYYAGKTFVVELFDAGESSDDGFLQVVGPGGAIWDQSECRIFNRDDSDEEWALHDTNGPGEDCEELVEPQEYHDRWLKFEVDLPTSYNCDVGSNACWWRMNYAYDSDVNDTTTWRAYMIGNPIHLVGP